ncbi:MAG: TIGR01777 family oxidoreductase [Actinomycetota bacterium]|nr:TIGR01777 family oxidoreductase [Actinomycetota bacterium]
MRVVVAGSSGLIGTALVALLRRGGHDVIRLVRREPASQDERGWDPPAGRIDDDALDGADALVNLCGVGLGDKRWTAKYKRQLRDSRIVPTEVLADAVAQRGVPVMVNASGANYYGDTGDSVVDETDPAGRGFLAELCRDWEAATTAARSAGARVVITRSGVVISPSGGLLGQLRPLFALGLGGRLGSGHQYLPWISLDDAVGVIRFALEQESVRGPVNVVGPNAATNAEFTRALGEAMHRPAVLVVPGLALKAARGAELAEELVLTGPRVRPAVLEKHRYPFAHPTIGAALRAAVGA